MSEWVHTLTYAYDIHIIKNENQLESCKSQVKQNAKLMKKEYDFSEGKRGPVIRASSKTRITIHLDDDVINAFRVKSEASGSGYQTLINDALRQHLATTGKPVDTKTLRRILREELNKTN